MSKFSKIELTIANNSSSELDLDTGLLRGLDKTDKDLMKTTYDKINKGETVVIPLSKDRVIPINIRYGTAELVLGNWSAGTFKIYIDKSDASVKTDADEAIEIFLYALIQLAYAAAVAAALENGAPPPPAPPSWDQFKFDNKLSASLTQNISNDTLYTTVTVEDAS